MSYVFINIHEYLNKIIRIFNLFGQIAIYQHLFCTTFCSARLVNSGRLGHDVGIPHLFVYQFSLISYFSLIFMNIQIR